MRRHQKKRLVFGFGLALAILLAVGVTYLAAAHASPQYDLSWNALADGGGMRSSSNYLVQDILGQTAPGSSQFAFGGGTRQIAAGFYGPNILAFSQFLPAMLR